MTARNNSCDSLSVVGFLILLLLVVYALSAAPVAVWSGGQPILYQAAEYFYHPIWWLQHQEIPVISSTLADWDQKCLEWSGRDFSCEIY